jgi:hypothetical protein
MRAGITCDARMQALVQAGAIRLDSQVPDGPRVVMFVPSMQPAYASGLPAALRSAALMRSCQPGPPS